MPQTDTKNPGSDSVFILSQPLDLVGIATSDWQMHPENGESEWGEEVQRVLRGEPTRLKASFNRGDLPSCRGHECSISRKAAELGGNAYRMSLDFAELCPSPGVFRADRMQRYVRILAECRTLGLEPVVTLHHFTHPKRFAAYDRRGRITRGALEHPDIVEHFRFFIESVASFLYDPTRIRSALTGAFDDSFIDGIITEPLASRFVTINEPSSITMMPYVTGDFPPYRRGRLLLALGLEEKLRAMHRIAHRIFHDVARRAGIPDERAPRLGMAHGVVGSFLPVLNHLAGWGMLERMERGQETDFLGLQYYSRERIWLRFGWPFASFAGFDRRFVSDAPMMEVYPAGIREVLHRAHRLYPSLPLFVTEFGFADRTDRKRPLWLLDTVAAMIKGAEEGLPLQGALLWTLLDNFEWQFGMKLRFGLLAKDGQRLPSDDGAHLSSREAWAACARHLLHPTVQSAAELSLMRQRAWAQMEEEVAAEQISKGKVMVTVPNAQTA